MDKVIIKDLLARGVIGVYEDERKDRQNILVNIVLYADTKAGAASDDIKDCVNYRTVAKSVLKHIEETQRYTVEALAGDIANICLGFPLVEGVNVRVEKPGAVRFSRSVGVEIERFKK